MEASVCGARSYLAEISLRISLHLVNDLSSIDSYRSSCLERSFLYVSESGLERLSGHLGKSEAANEWIENQRGRANVFFGATMFDRRVVRGLGGEGIERRLRARTPGFQGPSSSTSRMAPGSDGYASRRFLQGE